MELRLEKFDKTTSDEALEECGNKIAVLNSYISENDPLDIDHELIEAMCAAFGWCLEEAVNSLSAIFEDFTTDVDYTIRTLSGFIDELPIFYRQTIKLNPSKTDKWAGRKPKTKLDYRFGYHPWQIRNFR